LEDLMIDRAEQIRTETVTLQKADRDIREGWERLLHQQILLLDLQARGSQSKEAERLVELLRETLQEWERHRVLIVQRLAYLKDEPAAMALTWTESSGVS
jgi:hypothetical protein